jgi:hypothetical protein
MAGTLLSEEGPLLERAPDSREEGEDVYDTASDRPSRGAILHSRADETVPFSDSVELVPNSGIPESAIIVVGHEHLRRLGIRTTVSRSTATAVRAAGSVAQVAEHSQRHLQAIVLPDGPPSPDVLSDAYFGFARSKVT